MGQTNINTKVPLPSFKKPPINEVVCGVRFFPPDNFRVPHIGLLWEKFRPYYPVIQHAPPLVSAKGEIAIDKTLGVPLPRIWFINKEDDQLIQFQIDRIYFNWRRRKNDYPRYSYVIKHFENLWDIVVNLFNEFNLGNFNPIECELTYVNHIPKGEGWNTIKDLSKIFNVFTWNHVTERFLQEPENVAWQTNFKLPENKGSLTISLKQAIRTEDQVPLFVLELTARGPAESNNKDTILKWFDLAHEWIVLSFVDLTTQEVQTKVWERENDI